MRALEQAGYDVLALREPGGVAISEKIRALLLDPVNAAMCDTCELLLYEAARAQLVHEVIAPALATGRVVVCDRFFDSTTAYQTFGGTVPRERAEAANGLAAGAYRPAITLVYDIDPAIAAQRAAARAGVPDRMEAKGLAYQERVAMGFRAIAAAEPERVKLIDAVRPIAEVFADTVAALRAAGFELPEDAIARALDSAST